MQLKKPRKYTPDDSHSRLHAQTETIYGGLLNGDPWLSPTLTQKELRDLENQSGTVALPLSRFWSTSESLILV